MNKKKGGYSVDVKPGEKVVITKTKKRRQRNKTKRTTTHQSYSIEREVVKNLIELQKVHTNLAEKFDKLSTEISHLLALFEVTARTFAKTVPAGEHEKDREFLEKIDKLLDQNKILAKGLTLMEERLREKMYGPPMQKREEPRQTFMPQRIPPKF